MCEDIQLMFAVLRIGIYSIFRRICGCKPPPAKPNFTVLCIGLEKSGKSSLLALMSGEKMDSIEPTVGFSIKALMFADCFVDVKELGGSDNVRKYWDRYFTGAQGVIFVVNSSDSEEQLKCANNELHKALGDPALDDLPLLVLCNYQDEPNARSVEQLSEILELSLEDGHRKYLVRACSIKDKENVETAFRDFNKCLMHRAVPKNEEFANIEISGM